MNCPVCATADIHSVGNSRRVFSRCGFCSFSRAGPGSRPEEETSRRSYPLHQKGEPRENYSAFLSRIIDRALTYTGNHRNEKTLPEAEPAYTGPVKKAGFF
jgi:hypothetical protein